MNGESSEGRGDQTWNRSEKLLLIPLILHAAAGEPEHGHFGALRWLLLKGPDRQTPKGSSWYWNEKAHLDTSNQNGFWGDDAISNFFKNISNSFIVPFWNAVMEYDFVRVGVLLVLAGMLLGFGASLMLPKKEQK